MKTSQYPGCGCFGESCACHGGRGLHDAWRLKEVSETDTLQLDDIRRGVMESLDPMGTQAYIEARIRTLVRGGISPGNWGLVSQVAIAVFERIGYPGDSVAHDEPAAPMNHEVWLGMREILDRPEILTADDLVAHLLSMVESPSLFDVPEARLLCEPYVVGVVPCNQTIKCILSRVAIGVDLVFGWCYADHTLRLCYCDDKRIPGAGLVIWLLLFWLGGPTAARGAQALLRWLAPRVPVPIG